MNLYCSLRPCGTMSGDQEQQRKSTEAVGSRIPNEQDERSSNTGSTRSITPHPTGQRESDPQTPDSPGRPSRPCPHQRSGVQGESTSKSSNSEGSPQAALQNSHHAPVTEAAETSDDSVLVIDETETCSSAPTSPDAHSDPHIRMNFVDDMDRETKVTLGFNSPSGW